MAHDTVTYHCMAIFPVTVQISFSHYYSFIVSGTAQTRKTTLAPQTSLLCKNWKPQPTMFQNIIKWLCFTGSTAEIGGVKESTYDDFVFPMDRSTQVMGSTKERMTSLE